MTAQAPRPPAGFTLVELVTVIALSAILGLVVWRNLGLPIRAFEDGTRRAAATAGARLAVMRMSRELRLALPNSIRVSPDGTALEMLRTSAGGRYRAAADPADPASDPLDLALPVDTFQPLGGWSIPATVRTGADIADCLGGSADCLVIYNTGSPADCASQPAGTRTSAWCGDNIAVITAATPATGVLGISRGAGATAWPTGSPRQRFYIVDAAISFVCADAKLRRHAGYAIGSTQTVPPGTSGALLADHVASCQFGYQAGSASRAGLVSIRVTLAYTNPDGDSEEISLLEQVHVQNSP